MAVCLLAATVAGEPIPFDPSRGLVEVDVVVNGHIKGKFGIDTGADRLYVDKGFAQRNGLEVKAAPPQRDVVAMDGSVKPMATDLRSLSVGGDETLYNLSATVIDIAALTADTSEGILDGLLGYDILRRFYVTVDYPNRTIELQTAEPAFLRGNQYTEIPFETHRHLILVGATIENIPSVPMLLDYCASYTLFDSSKAERFGLNPSEKGVQRIGSLKLARIESEDVPVIVRDYTAFKRALPRAEFAGVLGASFLWQFKITVDYKRKSIYIHK